MLADISDELCEKPRSFQVGVGESIKVLGMQWCPNTDSFFYVVSDDPSVSFVSKRQVLAFVAKIYDCNGYLSPVTVWMKVFLQKLWLDNHLSWDTPLSKELSDKWKSFTSELSQLSELKISRPIDIQNVRSISLIGFSDASNAAYAACVYLRVCDADGNVKTYLIRGKTKVAPLKIHTINRLELCAALLLAKLVQSLEFLQRKLSIHQVYLFTDSFTVLSWLKTEPYRLKIYVSNRVSQILELTKPGQWYHVKTDLNSADPASRGIMPSQLLHHGLWFKGPAFLQLDPDSWPAQPSSLQIKNVPELKSTVATSLVAKTEDNNLILIIQKYSLLCKLKRIMALVLRFIHNLRNPDLKRTHALTLTELQEAFISCVKITQRHHFSDEIKSVKLGQACPSNLIHLSPLINSAGMLALGGRLIHAPIPESAKHPILIPKKSHLAVLLVRYYHMLTIHGGPQLVHALLQQKFWIVGARNLIRSTLSKCVLCIKRKPTFHQPPMANLPKSRFAQGRAFLNVGVDLAGPFSLKSGPRRNSPIVKAYFAIFVCMSVKAVHLELLSSLTTPCFLASLDRFIWRRGLPNAIYSDNGTNFQGAARHLSETFQFLSNAQNQISAHLLKCEISWVFNPPSAPNFGGLWEVGVKSVKKHLKHVLSDHSFNFEEFSTILIQIEAILNSRPLCAVGVDPNEGVNILTPGHFLTGAPLLARPENDISNTYIPPLKRWLLVAQATQCFWKRWRADYLNTLIQRNKWTSSVNNLKVNDVVIIHNPNCPPQEWPLGIVIKVMPGEDDVVRVVTVRTAHGVLIRPASKLAVLPVGDTQC